MGSYTVRKFGHSMHIILPRSSGFQLGDCIEITPTRIVPKKEWGEEDIRTIARDEAEKAIEEARR